jgi:hypothetical protein
VFNRPSKAGADLPLQWLFNMTPMDRGILAATRPDVAQVLLELGLPVQEPHPPVQHPDTSA